MKSKNFNLDPGDIGTMIFLVGATIRFAFDFTQLEAGSPLWPGQLRQAGLMLAFLLLFASFPLLERRFPAYRYPYLVVQMLITSLALLSVTELGRDYFAILYLILSLKAFKLFSLRNALLWTGLLCAFMVASLLLAYGLEEGGLRYVPTYISAILLTGLLAIAVRRAETAHQESQSLLARLQEAHQELQVYVDKVEELTTAQERNRLARELHDSVTQTIFSLTLTTEAARMLMQRGDTARLEKQLDRVHELAQDALAEMRSLIAKLRPKTIAEEGLVNALHRHAAERQERDDLAVTVRVAGSDQRLAIETQEALFRITQEALNNIVKHANTDSAEVTLTVNENAVSLSIEDQGAGFELTDRAGIKDHFGIASMKERTSMLGGELQLESEPGAGTRVTVIIPFRQEGEQA